MTRTVRTRLVALGVGSALAAGGLAAAVVSGTAAGAAGHCTAWAAVPAKVALTSHTVIRPTLVGTSGCRAGSFDGGATATLRGPGREPNPQRWERFGAREQVDLYRGLDRPGTYTFSDGDVQVYDSQSVRVPSSWRTTSVVVKYGSSFTAVSDRRRTTSATLKRYTADGRTRSGHTRVALQKRTAGGWKTVAHRRTASDGTVAFRHGAGDYRLVTASTASTWGASTAVR